MNITFSANNNKEVLSLPFLPSEIEINDPYNNEEFQTINNGVLNLIGTKGLRTLSISSFFATKKYSFAKHQKNGWDCVRFFEKWRGKRVPFRIVVTDKKEKEILNMACTIDNFNHKVDRAGDIIYTLDIKEFVIPKVM